MAKEKKSFAAQLIGVGAFVVLFIVMLNMCSGDKDEPTTTSPRPATPSTSAQDTLGGSVGETVEAWVAAQQFVKAKLISPSTAKFNGVARSPYVVYLGGCRYRVTASVDSQNNFGAMLRTEFEAIVRAKRDDHQTWVLESLEF